jgi:hypothetical protein
VKARVESASDEPDAETTRPFERVRAAHRS